MEQRTTIKKKRMVEALTESLGIITVACEKAGINRTTHYRWLSEDAEYKQAVGDIENVALDAVESALFDRIREGDTTAIIFYLKTKGKKRGYIERQEIDLGKDIVIEFKD